VHCTGYMLVIIKFKLQAGSHAAQSGTKKHRRVIYGLFLTCFGLDL